MNSKIMQVFFGEDCLPYKDVERTIHYPIVGNAISGSSNVNEIRFYTHRIGGATNTTWVAISKLPNGKTSTEILSTVVEDTELGEYYVVFNLTSYYTQFKGDLFISLQGFQNGVTFTLVNDVYQLSGTPTVQATGSIKIPINYAPVVHNYELPPDQLTQILALFSSYNPTINSIVVLLNISADISGYEEGQVFFVKSDGAFYRKNAMGTLALENKIKARLVAAEDRYQLSNYDVLYQDENGDLVISCANGQKVVYNGSEIANKEYTDENFADSVNVTLNPSTTDLEIEIELLNKNNQTIGAQVFYIDPATSTTSGLLSASNKTKLDKVPNDTNFQLGLKIDKASIVDNLTTDDATKVLSAKQGKNLEDKKVDKTTTIMGIDLANNITRSEIITAIGEATQSLSGVMSATDKARLDALHSLLNEGSANDVVDSINEVLAIFNNYPEGADLVTALAGKVDKENGMGLSHNDYSDAEKGKVTTAHNHSQATGNPHTTKFSELNEKPTTIAGYGITDAYTKTYIDSLKDMNGWESELITETPLTNGQSVTLVTLQSFDVIKLFARNTSTNEIDTDSFETSIGLEENYKYILFDDANVYFTIGATNCTFTTSAGFTLSIIGQKYTELDSALSDISTNAVQNKVIKEALDDKADLDYAEETYAKQDGDYAVAGLRAKSAVTAETAEQLFATKSVVDKVPYLYRTSGGSADIGNRSSGSIVGCSVVVNQKFNQNAPNDFAYGDTRNGITITLVENQIILNGTATANTNFAFGSPVYTNHIYLRRNLKSNGLGLFSFYSLDEISIVKANSDNNYLSISVIDGTILDNVVYPGYCVDLTQALGSTIADYIYDLEVANAGAGIAWFNTHFPKYPLDYNVGTLTHVEGLVSHDMIGFNQYNGDYAKVIANNKYCISGAYTDLEFALTEEGATSAVSITTENGHDYFTPTQNGFVFVNGAGANTCINLSWSGTKDGEYEDYVKHSYPLDNDVILRGIPKLDVNNKLYYDGDIYSSDGKVKRRYALVDMGTLTWVYDAIAVRFYAPLTNPKQNSDPLVRNGTFICPLYTFTGQVLTTDKTAFIGIQGFPRLYVYDSAYTNATAYKTAMSGVYLLYEVETPTEETFDQFINPQIVNDWGTEEFVVETPLIPVGHDTAYPINILDKVQNAPDLPSTTGDYIMHYELDGRVATYVSATTWLLETSRNIITRNEDVIDWVYASSKYGLNAAGQSNPYKTFSMLVVTDLHSAVKQLSSAVYYLENIPSLDMGCLLGDTQSNYSDNDGSWITTCLDGTTKQFVIVCGNHDIGNSKLVSQAATKAQYVAKFVAPNLSHIGVSTDKAYYSFTNATHKLYFIVLNNYDSPDTITGDEFDVFKGAECYSQEQINWFISELGNVPSDYTLVILAHSFPWSNTRFDCNFSQPDAVLIGNGRDCYAKADNIIPRIINAWKNKTTLSFTATSLNEYVDDLTISADFSDRTSSNFACYLVGHSHKDIVAHSTDCPDQLVIGFTTASFDNWNNEHSDLIKIQNNKSEDAITVFSIDTSRKLINLVRIGSNKTINMIDRTKISIAYD